MLQIGLCSCLRDFTYHVIKRLPRAAGHGAENILGLARVAPVTASYPSGSSWSAGGESSRCLRFWERPFGLLEVNIDWYDAFWLALWRSGLVCNGWQLLYKIVAVVETQVKTDPVGLIMVKIPGVLQLQFLSKGQNIHLLASKCKLLSGLWGPPPAWLWSEP